MCLLDTIDGALMMALYTSTAFAKDQIAILYYSIVLTVITVTVAIVIGFIQTLTLVRISEPVFSPCDQILSVETCLESVCSGNRTRGSTVTLQRADTDSAFITQVLNVTQPSGKFWVGTLRYSDRLSNIDIDC